MEIKVFKNMVLALVAVVFLTSCDSKTMVLADNGKTDYKIVFSDDTLKPTAAILAQYLHTTTKADFALADKTSGKDIQLSIDASLPEQAFEIKADGQSLQIRAASTKAIDQALFSFLEKELGCRWYAPDADLIPTHEKLTLPKDYGYVYKPEIKVRTVHSKLFYDNPDFAQKQKVTTEAFPSYVPSARVHTFHKFLPEEAFYVPHPEYYALRNGKRLPTQLCLTNTDVLKKVIDSVGAYFKRHPEATVLSVSQDDNQQYCTCDNCSKIDTEEGSQSGTMIRFVNQVAQAFPDKTISTLAYQHTRKPCKTKPADNVLITLCSIECDRSGPIEEKCQDFASDLKGWGKLTKNIRIWDYTTQFTNFLAPFPNIHTLQPNIKFFRDQGAKWVFEQHSGNPSELFELRSYLTAKLLWNPDLDQEALITDFTDGYYGLAGSHIRQYIDLIHQRIQNDPEFFLFLYGDPSEAFTSYLSPKYLIEYVNVFDTAETMVESDPVLLNRVRKARLSTDYAVLEAAKKGLSDTLRLTQTTLGKIQPNPFIEKVLKRFSKTISDNTIPLMNEMGYKPEAYISNYQKLFQVAAKPNKAKGAKVTLLTRPKKYANEDPQTLTDGALGGNGFYANWLGFEGNDLEAIIDLGQVQEISEISTAFLKVTNHVVFYPESVTVWLSTDGNAYEKVVFQKKPEPLTKKTKKNEIQYFDWNFPNTSARFIKVKAKNMGTPPYWHHAAGQPAWIFMDELMAN